MFTKKTMTWIAASLLAVAIPAVGSTSLPHHLAKAAAPTAKPTSLMATHSVKTAVHHGAKPLAHHKHHVKHHVIHHKTAVKHTVHKTSGVKSMHSGHPVLH